MVLPFKIVSNRCFGEDESFGGSVLCDDVAQNGVILEVFLVCDQRGGYSGLRSNPRLFGTLGAVRRKAGHLRLNGGGMKLVGNCLDVCGAKSDNHGIGESGLGNRR